MAFSKKENLDENESEKNEELQDISFENGYWGLVDSVNNDLEINVDGDDSQKIGIVENHWEYADKAFENSESKNPSDDNDFIPESETYIPEPETFILEPDSIISLGSEPEPDIDSNLSLKPKNIITLGIEPKPEPKAKKEFVSKPKSVIDLGVEPVKSKKINSNLSSKPKTIDDLGFKINPKSFINLSSESKKVNEPPVSEVDNNFFDFGSTKQEIKDFIQSDNKFKNLMKDNFTKNIYDFLERESENDFDFDKELQFIKALLDFTVVPWSIDLDKKFKELFMIYFFERVIAHKKVKDIVVPIFNNVNINWNNSWKQANKNMSVCFDFSRRFNNDFKLSTMKDCKNYLFDKMNGVIFDNKENLNYLIARAGMTDELYEIIKEDKNVNNWANNTKIIDLLGEYYIAEKLLYGKPTSMSKTDKDYLVEEYYVPENLDYIEKICDGFDKNKYLLRQKVESNDFHFKSDIFKISWMRTQDKHFSDNDFFIQYPVYPANSLIPKGSFSRHVEVKSTKNFYEYLSENNFNKWVSEKGKISKDWKDYFKLTLKEFYSLKNNPDYTLLRVYGINYDFSNLKFKKINSKNDLEGLYINHVSSDESYNSDLYNKNNQRVVVVRMTRYYILKQILAFFSHYNLFSK